MGFRAGQSGPAGAHSTANRAGLQAGEVSLGLAKVKRPPDERRAGQGGFAGSQRAGFAAAFFFVTGLRATFGAGRARKSVVWGKSVSVSVGLGGAPLINKKNTNIT